MSARSILGRAIHLVGRVGRFGASRFRISQFRGRRGTIRLLLGGSLLVVVGGLTVGGADQPERVDWRGKFAAVDGDGDDRVTRAEWDRSDLKANSALFKALDANGDEAITRDEAAKYFDGASDDSDSSTKTESESAGAAQGPRPLPAAARRIGRLVPDVEYVDISGKSRKLSDDKSKRAVVIAFTSTSCPLSQKFLPTLADLEAKYADRGVAFLFVNPVDADRVEQMREAVSRESLQGSYVHDREGDFARKVGALTTTEVIVIDGGRTVLYQGAVDDQYGFAYSLPAPRVNYLDDALAAILANLPPVVVATEAPGCTLDLDAAPSPASVTYHNRISRIVQQACAECHRDGGVGPFSLTSYDELNSHKAMVAQVVERGQMPPWFAAPATAASEAGASAAAATGEGAKAASVWRNDRSLSAEDKADLIAWLKSDRPLGDPADAVVPRVYPTEWRIGQPDLVVQLTEPVAIQATGTMPYVNRVVDPQLTEDKWVNAWEVLPTSLEVVHHVLVFVVPPTGEGEPKAEEEDERQGFFAAYVPGAVGARYEEGFAKRVPAGSKFRFQLHYTPNGKATADQTRLALTFASEPPRHEVRVTGIVDSKLRIPPGAANHEEGATLPVPADARLLGLMPHMHVRGKAFRYELVDARGKVETLLDIPRYDFNWQLGYQFNEPLLVRAGSTLRVKGWFDNSTENPANPDATKLVRWGPQTDDEMLIGYVEYYLPNETPETRSAGLNPGRPGGLVGQIERIVRQIDVDKDLRITRQEFSRLKEFAPRLAENEKVMDRLFKQLDKDGDGLITVPELQSLRR